MSTEVIGELSKLRAHQLVERHRYPRKLLSARCRIKSSIPSKVRRLGADASTHVNEQAPDRSKCVDWHDAEGATGQAVGKTLSRIGEHAVVC